MTRFIVVLGTPPQRPPSSPPSARSSATGALRQPSKPQKITLNSRVTSGSKEMGIARAVPPWAAEAAPVYLKVVSPFPAVRRWA